jgi:putative transposase
VPRRKPEDLTGEGGLVKQLKKALIERALGAELTDHLGYDRRGSGNSRNGTSSKTVLTEEGEIEISIPAGPRWNLRAAAHRQRTTRFDGFDDKILSLYARDMSVREIQGI